MDSGYYGPLSRERLLPDDRRKRLLAMGVLGTLLLAAMMYVAPSLLPISRASSRQVSPLVYHAPLSTTIPHPTGDMWTMPAQSLVVDRAYFALDTGNNRILKLDSEGRIIDTFGDAGSGYSLQMPIAIATDGEILFVANSLAGEILVIDTNGGLLRRIMLPSDVNASKPRPIGIAAVPGGIVVSDAEHHRVLRINDDGEVVWTAGTGTRASGEDGFNAPGAIALDARGTIYVVDTLNARVVKLSADGRITGEIGGRGDTAGTLSRPKGIAIDPAGRVFVSDGLLAAVEVFAPDGQYLGLIGREDPSDSGSDTLFMVPHGLALSDGRLIVTDRYAGIFAFDLPGASPTASD